MKKPFMDKVVVVTGGASGIGRATAEYFAREGAKIALLDMDPAALGRAADDFVESGYPVFTQKCDVSIEKECTSAITDVIGHYGGIDVLFNNAGITQRSPFINTDPSVYRRVMDVNYFGSVYCASAAIESIIERKGMVIVTSSIAGVAPLIGRTGYCASKHALHGFFETLRCELADAGVHVMMVCPGFTTTNLQCRALDGDGSVTRHPQSTVGKQYTAESVAQAIYRGAVKRKSIIVLSAVGKISCYMMRFMPGVYEKVMSRSIKKEIRR